MTDQNYLHILPLLLFGRSAERKIQTVITRAKALLAKISLNGGRERCLLWSNSYLITTSVPVLPGLWTIARKRDHFPPISKDESFIMHLLWWSDRVVTTGMARGALVASGTCPETGFARPRMCQQAQQAFPHRPNPRIVYRGEMVGWGRGQAWRMIDGRWLRSPSCETTTSPELDRVSVMAGGNLWHLPLPPSLSSHRKAAGVLPVRAKAIGGVCEPRHATAPISPN